MKKTHLITFISIGLLAVLWAAGCQRKIPSEPGYPTATRTITQTHTASPTPTTTATASVTPTITETATECVFAGSSDTSQGGFLNSADTLYEKYTFTTSATVYRIAVYVYLADSYRVGIYSDASGAPGTLLTSNTTAIAMPTGLNIVNVPDLVVSTGDYWIAVSSQTSGAVSFGDLTGHMLYRDHNTAIMPVNPSAPDLCSPNSSLAVLLLCNP